MKVELSQIKENIQCFEHNPAHINMCKLNLKRMGLDDKKIELIERNLRAIMNHTLNNLEHE